MPHYINTTTTVNTCIEHIKNNKRGLYLRYGDGDYNIVRWIPDMLCIPTNEFVSWMKISMSLRGDTIMTCIPHHCRLLNTLEDGICPGNHEYDGNNVMMYLQILNNYAPLPSNIYSNIALSYSSSRNPQLVVELHKVLKRRHIVFFGNMTYTDSFLKLLFGEKLDRINTNARDSYLDHDTKMNEFDILYKNKLVSMDYFVIIMAAGCGGRAYSAELYRKYDSNFFIFDYGSLIDYLAGENTRAYMDIDPPQREYILKELSKL